MTTARELMEKSRATLERNAVQASAVGGVYKFVLSGDGGGTFVVSLKGAPQVTEGDGSAECTIMMAAVDYVDLMEGRARGQDLFFAGKMQIDGDISLALKLEALTAVLV